MEAERVSGEADQRAARKTWTRKVVPQLRGGGLLFWAKMMSLAARSGALSPYMQATKHTVKSLTIPGAKQLVPAAGKGELRTCLVTLVLSCVM